MPPAKRETMCMSLNKPLYHIAWLSALDWTAQFPARGFDVIATDAASNAEFKLRKSIDAAWKALAVIASGPEQPATDWPLLQIWMEATDGIENLNEEDFYNLLATIKHLQVMLHKWKVTKWNSLYNKIIIL
jgi:hypothetical protein